MFGAPITSRLYQKNQIQVIENDIKSAIRFAKVHALTTGNHMYLTPLPNAAHWSSGMQLYVNNEPPQIIQEWHWQHPAIHVTWHGFQSNQYLLFSPEVSRNAVNGYFVIKANGSHMIKLMVNRMGRVRAVNVDYQATQSGFIKAT